MDVHPDIARLGTNRIPGRKKENWDAGHDCPASFISRRKTMRKNLDRFMNKPGTKIIILTLTNQCNLRCTYCYEHNKETRTMELQTALDIIERDMTMILSVSIILAENLIWNLKRSKRYITFLEAINGKKAGMALQPQMEPWFTEKYRTG